MLWLIDPETPDRPYPADLLTALVATAIAAGLMDAPDLPVRSVADPSKVRQEGSYD